MKKVRNYLALLFAALFFVNCTDEDIISESIPLTGDEISFGVQAVVDTHQYGKQTVTDEKTKESRTVYGEVALDKKSVQIHWVGGDELTIGSNQSVGAKVATYRVPALAPSSSTSETLERVTANKGLQWGTEPHDFYGVYPSTEKLDVLSLKLDPSSKKLTGFMPSTYKASTKDTPIPETNQILHTVEPNMDYAIMAAQATGVNPTNNVQLTFSPIVTVIEFDVMLEGYVNTQTHKTETIEMLSLTLKSKTQSISGKFEYDYDTKQVKNLSSINDGTNAINLKFEKPVHMNEKDRLRATVFFIPSEDGDAVADLEKGDLTLSFAFQDETGGIFFKNATLNVDFFARKKYFFRDMQIPALNKLTSSNWFSQLDDNIYISQLSFPGAAHVVSSQYKETDAIYHKEQVLPFQQLWNKGIRGFELRSSCRQTKSSIVNDLSKEATGLSTVAGATFTNNEIVTAEEFAATPFVCATKEVLGAGKYTVGGAFANGYSTIKRENKETLVYVMTYQSYTGDGTDGIRPDLYLQGLENFLTKFCEQEKIGKDTTFVKIGTESTVGDLRGRIAIIVRLYDDAVVYQNGDVDQTKLKPTPEWAPYITVVNDWGSCIDNWDVRYGQSYAREGIFKDHNHAEFETKHLWYGLSTSDQSWIDINHHNPQYKTHLSENLPRRNLSETYRFNMNGDFHAPVDPNNHALVQCWERVIPEPDVKYYSGDSDNFYPNGEVLPTRGYLYYSWPESLEEKVAAMKYVADVAMSSRNIRKHNLFINWLSGYFPVGNDKFPGSPVPYTNNYAYSWGNIFISGLKFTVASGQNTGGDYSSCAGALNHFLYQYLSGKKATELGPLGLVMMGYLYGEDNDFPKIESYENLQVPGTKIVYKEDAAVASSLLPRLILANNFHFPLVQKKTGQDQTSTDNSQSFEENNDIISFK